MGKKLFISPNTQEQSSIFGKLELNLSAGDLPEGYIEMDVSSLSFASFTIQTANSNSTGIIELKQGNVQGNLFPLVTPVVLTLGPDVLIGGFDIPISGSRIGLDISNVSWGNTGRVIITINVKKNGGGGQPYITTSAGGSGTSSLSLLEVDGEISIDDNVTTGGFIAENTCIWCKIENISGSVVAAITTATDNIALQPGESFYEEMQLLDKIYRQARVEYNPGSGGLLRITKKLRT